MRGRIISPVRRVSSPQFCLTATRFGTKDIKALGVSQLSGLGQTMLQVLDRSVLWLHVTALFQLENSRKSILKADGMPTQRQREESGEHASMQERERPPALWLLFCNMFLHSPLCLPYVNWAFRKSLFVLPEVHILVLRPSFSFICSIFYTSLIFSHHICSASYSKCLTQLFWGRAGDFQGWTISTFGLLMVPWKCPWHLWQCHLTTD